MGHDKGGEGQYIGRQYTSTQVELEAEVAPPTLVLYMQPTAPQK